MELVTQEGAKGGNTRDKIGRARLMDSKNEEAAMSVNGVNLNPKEGLMRARKMRSSAIQASMKIPPAIRLKLYA